MRVHYFSLLLSAVLSVQPLQASGFHSLLSAPRCWTSTTAAGLWRHQHQHQHQQQRGSSSLSPFLLSRAGATASPNSEGDEGVAAAADKTSTTPTSDEKIKKSIHDDPSEILKIAVATTAAAALLPVPAMALAGGAGGAGAAALKSALFAYLHYVSILAIFGILVAEKMLIQPGMSVEDERTLTKIDLAYGVLAAVLIVSGFVRTTVEKGGTFYLNEPLFWLKMAFAGVWGGLSIFPSITFYRRNLSRKEQQQQADDGSIPPVSEKLANRLQQVINAELTAMLSIPLVATLMARGVWYWDGFPWPAGAAVSVGAMVGAFYLYGKQALTWSED